MSSKGDDRSVRIGGNATANQIITGDKNRATMKGVKVKLPPPDKVDPVSELAQLRELLASLKVSGQASTDLNGALDAADAEAAKAEPDKNWMGTAIERALKIAKGATDFGENVEKIAPKVTALAAWLGANWHTILGYVGMAA